MAGRDILEITSSQMKTIIDHADSCRPEEACGILAGCEADGLRRIENVYLVENAAHSSTFYEMDSREQFQVFDDMRVRELEPVCIFHSHPHSPAMPSGVDLELAFYPDSLYLIVSLAGDEPDCRVFRIADGQVSEAELRVLSD